MALVPVVGSRVRQDRPSLWGLVGKFALVVVCFGLLIAALTSGLGLLSAARWVAEQQNAVMRIVGRLFEMSGASAWGVASLLALCFLYGFFHAAGPGHGKFLIAGAGLANRVDAWRLITLSFAASLMQAVTALALVYGSFALLDMTADFARIATERVLVPMSYVAIVLVGLILVRRALGGLRAAVRGAGDGHRDTHHHDHAIDECCGHRHGPTAAEVQSVHSLRDAVMLVGSIGLRPCTGAVVVLVAAWRLDQLAVGAAATLLMALGTGALMTLVALSAVGARGATLLAAGAGRARIAAPILQLIGGLAIILIAFAFLIASLIA